MGDLHDRLRDDYGRIDPQLPQTAAHLSNALAAPRARHGGNRAHGRTAAPNPRRSSGAHLDRAERIHARSRMQDAQEALVKRAHASGAVAPVALPTTPRGCSRGRAAHVWCGAGAGPAGGGCAATPAPLSQAHSLTGSVSASRTSRSSSRLRFQPQWAWNPRIHEAASSRGFGIPEYVEVTRWLQFGPCFERSERQLAINCAGYFGVFFSRARKMT